MATAVGIGAAVWSVGQSIFAQPDCNFCFSSTGVSYKHPNTPLDKKYARCERLFWIGAYTPSPVPLDFVRKKNLGEKFWFRLSYDYNGNDLNNVRIEALPDKSSTLRKSVFKINFEPNKSSHERDPVAEVVFHITNSTWKLWDPIFANTVVGFSGDLFVRADGSARVERFKAEKGYVWFGSLSNNCPLITPFVRKRNFFSLAILFPFAKDTVSENEVRRIYEWVDRLPASTREKIGRGEITVNIEGFASRPGGELYNLAISERRANNVQNYLRKFTGSNTKFDLRSYGKYKQNLPSLFDVTQWVKRFLDPNKFDQAAIIWFEVVE